MNITGANPVTFVTRNLTIGEGGVGAGGGLSTGALNVFNPNTTITVEQADRTSAGAARSEPIPRMAVHFRLMAEATTRTGWAGMVAMVL